MEDFKKDIDGNTTIVGDFNTSLSKMDRSSKKKISPKILNNVLDQMDLTDTYIESLSPQRSKIHILFKCTWNIFKDRPHDRTQTRLNKFKKIEIISSIFSDHKGLKLETNLKENTQKHSNSRRLRARY